MGSTKTSRARDQQGRRSGAADEAGRRAAGALCAAVVLATEADPNRLSLRLVGRRGRGATVSARLALPLPYRPVEGDRLLVASAGPEHYVVGVVHAAGAPALWLSDGARIEVREGAAELRDPQGQLLMRYADGQAELCAPRGDLTLSAPEGRVILRSGMDVQREARRDVTQRAGRRLAVQVGTGVPAQLSIQPKQMRLETDRVEVEAKTGQAVVGTATVVARHISTTASTLAQSVERYELSAQKIVEKARDAFRDVAELLQIRAGRARTLVQDVYALYSRRTVMASKEDTSIDGKRILLG
ncbi:MAG: DUF3540 domain-containing protein [Deltaproteobacteria bacterium]|nr:DUF3540 domain-containing protein [Deltaproteobacteria bacterium]